MKAVNATSSADNFDEVIDRVITRIIEIQEIIKPQEDQQNEQTKN